MEFPVDQRHQGAKGILISGPPLREKLVDGFGRQLRHATHSWDWRNNIPALALEASEFFIPAACTVGNSGR
jgi:hypothetical protein